jgi:hypothetical protein
MARSISMLIISLFRLGSCLQETDPAAARFPDCNFRCGFISTFPATPSALSVPRLNQGLSQSSHCIQAVNAGESFTTKIRFPARPLSRRLVRSAAAKCMARYGHAHQTFKSIELPRTALYAGGLAQDTTDTSRPSRKLTVWELLIPSDGQLLLRAAACFALVLVRRDLHLSAVTFTCIFPIKFSRASEFRESPQQRILRVFAAVASLV